MRLTVSAQDAHRLRAYFDAPTERMAFAVAELEDDRPDRWAVTALRLLDDDVDYAERSARGLALADHVRPQVLRWAHEHGGALVEAHNHWHRGPVGFSRLDVLQLSDIVPGMIWRLPDRPYIAVVAGPDSLDALRWDSPGAPAPVEAVELGGRPVVPTGHGLRQLTGGRHPGEPRRRQDGAA